MSSRAIRRLREEQEKKQQDTAIVEEEDDHSEEEEEIKGTTANFAFLGDDSDEDSSSSSEEDEEDDKDESKEEETKELNHDQNDKKEQDVKEEKNDKKEEEEEDLDAILSEFKMEDQQSSKTTTTTSPTAHSILLPSTIDTRDFDLDQTLRTILGGDATTTPQSSRRRITRPLLFGGQPDIRPPHYIGGGIGMKQQQQDNDSDFSPPHPYSILPSYKTAKWHTFQHSDTYQKLSSEYNVMSSMGNVNLLATFVADHPFHAEAVLQLAMVFYRTGDAERGKELLRRSIQIWECACPKGFLDVKSRQDDDGVANLMDIHSTTENEGFVSALFRYIQISSMVGCIPTSLAVSRFVLSLDPLRDPMGVLLVMDYFALAMVEPDKNRLIIDLVESDVISIYHPTEDHCVSPLVHLPNWAYSYSLALYRQSSDSEKAAEAALVEAVSLHPSVVPFLLKKNNIDVTGRSCRTDWPTVLNKLPLQTPSQVEQKCIAIFVERSHALWSSDEIVQWVYDTLSQHDIQPRDDDDEDITKALERYQKVDPSDYHERFQTLPAEANPLDEGLVAPAMAIDPNRRRVFRRHMEGEMEMQDRLRVMMAERGMVEGIGGEMNMIDPDDPIMEVFWRSMLPWNHVEGVGRGGGGR